MATNLGRSINLISGVNGVSAGGQAIWLPPLNRRYHEHIIKCQGICFAGGTALTATKITGSGTGLKVDVTVASTGLVATIAPNSGNAGSGFTTGDTITFADPNYAATGYLSGFVGTVTASGGAVSAIAITTNGVQGPIQPALLLSTCRQLVAGVVMRDITPAQTLGILNAIPNPSGYSVGPGEFPVCYTEEQRNVLRRNDQNSWDVFGQPTYEIDFGINSNVSSPSITGDSEFDYQRNQKMVNGKAQLTLSPIKHKAFSVPIPSGQYDWTTLPINFPISRIWFVGSSPGNITRLEVYQDNNKIMESYTPEIVERYGRYGFKIAGASNTANNFATTWDAAFIADPDQRYGKYLICQNSLIVRVYSNAAQNLTAVIESAPGAYQ